MIIPTTTGCPICLDMSIPTDGPFVHCCELPGGRREFVGYANGQVFNYGPDCTAVASELQAHVDDLARQTAIETSDMLADAVMDIATLFGEPLRTNPPTDAPRCDCDYPAEWQVRESGGKYYFVCDPCYRYDFENNPTRTPAWAEADRIATVVSQVGKVAV